MYRRKLAKLWSGPVLMLTLGFASQASSQDWQHVGPVVSGEMRAFVDYQVRFSVPEGDVWDGGPATGGPASFQYDADPLWVNVLAPDLSEQDQVFVQIITYAHSSYRGERSDVQSISERELTFAEAGRFTGEMEPVTLSYQLNDGYALSRLQVYQQELVVWINGVLYQDANGRNLRIQMQR